MKKRDGNSRQDILASFRMLKGNTRISVMFEPLWGLPFVLFNFYLSLYMKGLGVTDREIGYLISIGYAAGTVISLFGGAITDRLGRRKATLIFDFISWPMVAVLYAVSHSFLLFAVATVANNFTRIVGVSWNLMVVEDATNEERIAAFNLLNIINITTGVLIPVAGLLVNAYGIVTSERIFLIYAAISMSVMVIGRNHFYRETSIGAHILEEHRRDKIGLKPGNILPLKAAAVFAGKPSAVIVVLIYVLFNVYIPLGSINSLYFAPYMTEVLKLDKSAISILGGVYSVVMLMVFIFVIPVISRRFDSTASMFCGLLIQAASLLCLTLLPVSNMAAAVLCIVVYAVGFSTFRPFIDSLMAAETDERERAGIYSIFNTVTCIATAVMGFVSGSMYMWNPKLIYLISSAILTACIVLLAVYKRLHQRMKVNPVNGSADS